MVCFAVLCVVAIGFVYKFLPETKGLSVDQAVPHGPSSGRRRESPTPVKDKTMAGPDR